jgi:hypothetical protein
MIGGARRARRSRLRAGGSAFVRSSVAERTRTLDLQPGIRTTDRMSTGRDAHSGRGRPTCGSRDSPRPRSSQRFGAWGTEGATRSCVALSHCVWTGCGADAISPWHLMYSRANRRGGRSIRNSGESLRIHVLGGLRVERNGSLIPEDGWPRSKRTND